MNKVKLTYVMIKGEGNVQKVNEWSRGERGTMDTGEH